MTVFHSALGDLKLSRWPYSKNNSLQAWDAADDYLLRHLVEQQLLNSDAPPKILIINDAHGALSCALQHYKPCSWSDSINSHTAAVENTKTNFNDSAITLLKSTDMPDGQFDLVLIKIPKTIALLEHQLIQLRSVITSKSMIIAAGMLRHMPRSAFQAFEKLIGPITTSLAVKKARLIFSTPADNSADITSPYPSRYTDEETGLTLANHANVFSRDHLDIGSRFLISQIPEITQAQHVVDLACGNGVLGIRYQQLHPDARLLFTDESYMAVDSARSNYRAYFSDANEQTQFIAQNGLSNVSDNSVDLILCNPPFHQEHAIGEGIATILFNDAKRCLRRGGQLWIVANHHLGYKDKLNRLFGHCNTVKKNRKFVVLCSIKRG